MNETSFDRIVCDLALRQELICVSIYLPLLRGEFVGEAESDAYQKPARRGRVVVVARGLRSVVARDLAAGDSRTNRRAPGFWNRVVRGWPSLPPPDALKSIGCRSPPRSDRSSAGISTSRLCCHWRPMAR